jgi:GAF domain protein
MINFVSRNKLEQTKMTKTEQYAQLIPQIKALIEQQSNIVGALCNVTALLKEAFDYYFWVGFYIVKDQSLQLGPFQGSVACYTIAKGKGVCGTSWDSQKTIIVDDVEQFEGHIACSSLSRSEIVVPVFKDNVVVAVIDVDSKDLASFDEHDAKGLESIAQLVAPLF